MIKAVILDFDGVIVESVDIKTEAFRRLFENEGPDVIGKIVAYHFKNAGVSRFDKFEYIYKNILKRELTEEKFGDLCKRFENLVVDSVVRVPYVKGAAEFLEGSFGKYKLFIVSATPQREIEDIVKHRKILKYFSAIYGAPRDKKEIVAEIMRKNNLKKDEVVCIGDGISDYEASVENGIRFIARIYDKSPLLGGPADYVKINDLQGVGGIL